MKRDRRKVMPVTESTAHLLGPHLEAELRQQRVVDVAGCRLRLHADSPPAQPELALQ